MSTGRLEDYDLPKPSFDYSPPGIRGDQMALTLQFQVSRPTRLLFNYVLASRELPEYMGRKYNDEFRMELNGENIAVLPAECQRRTIGTGSKDRPVSGATSCPYPSTDGTCAVSVQNLGQKKDNSDGSWSTCYVNNPSGEIFKGYTGDRKSVV